MIKYSRLSLGEIEAIVNKLGGMEGVKRFLAGTVESIVVWKTIKLGLHQTPEAYEVTIDKTSFRIGNYARQILKKIAVSETVVELDLCVMTVAELGFKRNARYDAICARIVEIGGQLCPAEVGPALRLHYDDQPYGEWNILAMEAIADSDGDPCAFGVGRGRGGLWLAACSARPGGLYDPDGRVVFVSPSKLES